MKTDIIIIGGPTAVGKTRTSIEMAKRFNGEVISADSMQIYKGLDIGSAKATPEEVGDIPHHLLSIVEPTDEYSAAEWYEAAKAAIEDIASRGKTPIIVGGTGLYINTLLYEMDFHEAEADLEFRAEMESLAKVEGNEAVHKILYDLDQSEAERIHPNNLKRVIRAIEINRMTGEEKKAFKTEPKENPHFNPVLIGLTGNRKKLYARINKRVDLMVDLGLLEEVKNLKEHYDLDDSFQSMKGIGYKEVLGYLEGRYDLDIMLSVLKQSSRRYAKRQMTWFRRYANLKWFDVDVEKDFDVLLDNIENYIKTQIKR